MPQVLTDLNEKIGTQKFSEKYFLICGGGGGSGTEAVPRTPWPGYGIQPVSGPLTPCKACSVP